MATFMARKTNNKKEYDDHIIDALLKLKVPIIGKGGKLFLIRDDARYESGIKHIASKSHRLKVRDIEMLPLILKHPKMVVVDPNNKNYRNYYGIRKGTSDSALLKIITWPYENNPNIELIVTIFPTKSDSVLIL